MRLIVNCWDVVGESVCVEVVGWSETDVHASASPQVLLRRWLRCPPRWLSDSTQAQLSALAALLVGAVADMTPTAVEGRTPGRVAEE